MNYKLKNDWVVLKFINDLVKITTHVDTIAPSNECFFLSTNKH